MMQMAYLQNLYLRVYLTSEKEDVGKELPERGSQHPREDVGTGASPVRSASNPGTPDTDMSMGSDFMRLLEEDNTCPGEPVVLVEDGGTPLVVAEVAPEASFSVAANAFREPAAPSVPSPAQESQENISAPTFLPAVASAPEAVPPPPAAMRTIHAGMAVDINGVALCVYLSPPRCSPEKAVSGRSYGVL